MPVQVDLHSPGARWSEEAVRLHGLYKGKVQVMPAIAAANEIALAA